MARRAGPQMQPRFRGCLRHLAPVAADLLRQTGSRSVPRWASRLPPPSSIGRRRSMEAGSSLCGPHAQVGYRRSRPCDARNSQSWPAAQYGGPPKCHCRRERCALAPSPPSLPQKPRPLHPLRGCPDVPGASHPAVRRQRSIDTSERRRCDCAASRRE
jgi:hypothetical protein